jgi:hypothetical protein
MMPGCFTRLLSRFNNSTIKSQFNEAPLEKQEYGEETTHLDFSDPSPHYTSPSKPSINSTIDEDALKIMENTIDNLSAELRTLSLDIWEHPETKLEVLSFLFYMSLC